MSGSKCHIHHSNKSKHKMTKHSNISVLFVEWEKLFWKESSWEPDKLLAILICRCTEKQLIVLTSRSMESLVFHLQITLSKAHWSRFYVLRLSSESLSMLECDRICHFSHAEIFCILVDWLGFWMCIFQQLWSWGQNLISTWN